MGEAVTREKTLRESRIIAAALVAGPALFLAVTFGMTPGDADLGPLVTIAMVLGLASLPVAWRLEGSMRERVPATAVEEERCRRYQVAFLVSLGVTEGAALFGLVAWTLTRNPMALVGFATHLLFAGATWPSEERLSRWIRGEA